MDSSRNTLSGVRPVQQHLIHHIPYQECPAQQHIDELDIVTKSYQRDAGTGHYSTCPGTGIEGSTASCVPKDNNLKNLDLPMSGWRNDCSLPCCGYIIGQALVIKHAPEVSTGADMMAQASLVRGSAAPAHSAQTAHRHHSDLLGDGGMSAPNRASLLQSGRAGQRCQPGPCNFATPRQAREMTTAA